MRRLCAVESSAVESNRETVEINKVAAEYCGLVLGTAGVPWVQVRYCRLA